jgi:cell division transport system permease protein
MLAFLRYTFRETVTNLWRNLLMTLAGVMIIAVSVSLVGGALMLKQSASQASAHWQQGTRVTIWMQPMASSAEVDAVRSQLGQLSYVKTCNFYTQMQDYHEAAGLIPQSEFQVLTVAATPSSFRCAPRVPSDVYLIQSTFANQPGVYRVTAPVEEIRQMQHTIHLIQVVALGLALVLLGAAIVLIFNTIRMAIFARRREVAVMKLVGATNWFIRIPFVNEGVVQGLFGSALAFGAMYAFQSFYPLHGIFVLSAAHFASTVGVVVLIAVGISTVGSWVAIRRFLDV